MARSKSRKRREQETGSSELDPTTRMNLGKRLSGAAGVFDIEANKVPGVLNPRRNGTRKSRKDAAFKDQY